MTMFQIFKKHKLPITINPLEYGKLLYNKDNLYVMWTSKISIAIIQQFDQFNNIKFFVNGELILEYKDHKINDNTFIRSISNLKFEFKDNVLNSVTSKSGQLIGLISFNNSLINSYIYNFTIFILIIKYQINYILRNYFLLIYFLSLIFMIYLNWLIFNYHNSFMLGVPKSLIYLGVQTLQGAQKRLFSYKSKKFYRSNWNSIYFKIENQIFSHSLLEFYFEKFWKIVSPKIEEGCHIFILLKIQFEDGNIHTIGKLIRINHINYKTFVTQITNYMEGIGDYYNQSPFNKIIFNYGFKRGEISDELNKTEINLMNFKDMKLPISIDPKDFGKILHEFEIENGKFYLIQDHLNRIINFKEYEKENLISYYKNQNLILEFKDIKFEENKFLRKLGKSNLFIENGNKTLETLELITPFISKIKKDKVETNNFITLDIETYGDSKLIPYLISFYDGSKSYSFYLSDFNSIEEMMKACFNKLFIRKYNNYSIYIHNLVKFDIYFLLKYLVKYYHIKPLIHNGRIIELKIGYGENYKYIMHFKDSYLILLSSLDKLAKNFKVETRKSIFPHKFVNENNLNYIGQIPDFKYFYNISSLDYNCYIENYNIWNMRDEAIRYCEIDCISLYQIILKFNSLIFNLFSKNIHRYPTLPSLAFSIFRSNFMENENIPKLTGNIEKDIRQGYTGGSTDMFIPYGENISVYDVNALYPSVMLNNRMPIGKPTKFIGDITKFEDNVFGFFKVNVKCPDDILHPIIQIKHKIKNSIKTISPVGNWSMWIFSEEMKNAMKYGYTFEILEGYKFNKSIVFKSYVDFLYNLRIQYSKDNPLNLIAKILLNSLYGRFGMTEITLKYEIISKSEFKQIKEIDSIWDSIELGDHVLVGLNIENEENSSNVSIGVAAAITAYARIFMTQFKNNPKIRLYYTDTDSVYISFDSELDPSLIDPRFLGKLKLEYICKEAVFLGPKSYCLKTENGLITKVKGLKDVSSLDIQDFKDLLIKDSYKIKSHKKWFRDFSNGNITIKDQLYTLIQTEYKRENIYLNNKLINTKAIKLNE